MENRFNNREFEHFVKRNADQYRMFPSEKVWKGINNSIHTRRKWYGIGLALLLLTTGTVTWVMLTGPGGRKELLADMPLTAITRSMVSTPKKAPAPIIPARSKESAPFVTTSVAIKQNPFIATINSVPETNIEESADFITAMNVLRDNSAPISKGSSISSEPVLAMNNNVSPANNRDIVRNKKSSIAAPKVIAENKTPAIPVTYIDDDFAVDEKKKQVEEQKISAELRTNLPPFTIESVVNSYNIRISKAKKTLWDIYFSPTVSYRKLTENKKLILNSQPINGPINYDISKDLNDVVKHKPDIGLELGIQGRIPLTNNLRFVIGAQLNVSKYDIKAYPFAMEEARVVLNSANGFRSVSTAETNYRATEAFTKPHWLSNFYVSASLPVGLEAKLAGGRRTFFGAAATVQPTYVIADRAYVISTDFKNYAKIPSLTRRTNINTSLELFAGYTTGKTKWRIGPQVRYQALSSFKKKYPIKEHLINYGLKLGITLN